MSCTLVRMSVTIQSIGNDHLINKFLLLILKKKVKKTTHGVEEEKKNSASVSVPTIYKELITKKNFLRGLNRYFLQRRETSG